jgi:hypothetical protein
MPLRQVGGDGTGGVAVQAVAGVIIPAGGAGSLRLAQSWTSRRQAPASRAKVIAKWRRQRGESCSRAPIPAMRDRQRTSSQT